MPAPGLKSTHFDEIVEADPVYLADKPSGPAPAGMAGAGGAGAADGDPGGPDQPALNIFGQNPEHMTETAAATRCCSACC